MKSVLCFNREQTIAFMFFYQKFLDTREDLILDIQTDLNSFSVQVSFRKR